MGGNTVMMCSSRQDQRVTPIRHTVESEPDETILNRVGVLEPSGVCSDQLLMRAAAAAAEGDYRVQRKGCWEGNQDEADLRQTDQQGLQGKLWLHFLPERSPPFLKHHSESGRLTSLVLMQGKWPWKEEMKRMEGVKPFRSVI